MQTRTIDVFCGMIESLRDRHRACSEYHRWQACHANFAALGGLL